jgi:hypothetical protein
MLIVSTSQRGPAREVLLHAHENAELLALGVAKDEAPVHHPAEAVVNRGFPRRILPRGQPAGASHAPHPARENPHSKQCSYFLSVILYLFAFIVHGGPPTNNHAERSLRPMVIFRKICLGTRSFTGWDNISIFGSLTQTAALHGSHPLPMFRALFKSAAAAQDIIYGHPAEASTTS